MVIFGLLFVGYTITNLITILSGAASKTGYTPLMYIVVIAVMLTFGLGITISIALFKTARKKSKSEL